MITATSLLGTAALTQLYVCRSELLRAEVAALNAADALTGPHQRHMEELCERLAYTTALVERLAIAIEADLP